jgi:hypothetical protein
MCMASARAQVYCRRTLDCPSPTIKIDEHLKLFRLFLRRMTSRWHDVGDAPQCSAAASARGNVVGPWNKHPSHHYVRCLRDVGSRIGDRWTADTKVFQLWCTSAAGERENTGRRKRRDDADINGSNAFAWKPHARLSLSCSYVAIASWTSSSLVIIVSISSRDTHFHRQGIVDLAHTGGRGQGHVPDRRLC